MISTSKLVPFFVKTVMCAIVLLPLSVSAQEWVTEEVLKQLAEIRQELVQVKEELREIKSGINKPAVIARPSALQPLANKEVSILGAPVMGDEKAQIAIVEFSDYECPFCRRHFTQTFPELKKNYVDTGKIKYVMKQYPLGFHAKAKGASIAALCAEQQQSGSYWNVHSAIFNGKTKLSREAYLTLAKELTLNTEKYSSCLDDPKMSAQVDKDIAEGTSVGVSGTPAFLIGKIENGKVINAQLISGARPYTAFTQVVDRLLSPEK
jgi:protein-disulfide isomerase